MISCGKNLSHSCFTPMQVFTGEVPFKGHTMYIAMLSISQGTRPPRPIHPIFVEDLWKLMKSCWAQDPQSRPTASEVLTTLLKFSSKKAREASGTFYFLMPIPSLPPAYQFGNMSHMHHPRSWHMKQLQSCMCDILPN